MNTELERAMFLCMRFDIVRYMIAVVRHDGAEKSQRHGNLIESFMRIVAPERRRNSKLCDYVRQETRALTDRLDTIGLKDTHFDDRLEIEFFHQFVGFARKGLKEYDN